MHVCSLQARVILFVWMLALSFVLRVVLEGVSVYAQYRRKLKHGPRWIWRIARSTAFDWLSLFMVACL